jgi:ADP-dependent NAD(P)H-hydrate dehydratase
MTAPAGITTIDDALLRRWPLPMADAEGDKESRGRVLVVAGSREMPGAALLAATAALRAGAGKLVVATPQSAAQTVAIAMPEARVIALPESEKGELRVEGLILLEEVAEGAAAALLGPGMTGGEATVAFLAGLLPRLTQGVVVLDALAMDCVLGLAPLRQAAVMTPHAGEMAHLTGEEKEAILAAPESCVARFAARWNAAVALKGADTCISNAQGQLWRHSSRCPGLGTSGSGDVLAGLVVGLAARGAAPEQAAAWGVALHARAGDLLEQRSGGLGFLARELAAEVPPVMHALAKAQ